MQKVVDSADGSDERRWAGAVNGGSKLRSLSLSLRPWRLAIARLAADAGLPDWARGEFVSLTRTTAELSIVAEAVRVPPTVPAERHWRALEVDGPIALSEIGVLADLAAPLAAARVSVFAISTYGTDYLLVPEASLEAAIAGLETAGHEVNRVG